MAAKPTNHVTKERMAQFAQRGSLVPDLTENLVAYLEALFPPVCFKPGLVTLENHLVYAGKVELIAYLRAQLTERLGEDAYLDPTIMPADLAGA